MQISLMTPQHIVWSGEASEVVLVGEMGQLDILDRHADLITRLYAGPVSLTTPQGKKKFDVTEGVVRVESAKCSILCMEAKEVA